MHLVGFIMRTNFNKSYDRPLITWMSQRAPSGRWTSFGGAGAIRRITYSFGYFLFFNYCFIIIIINIKDRTLWSVPSPELQLFAPSLLRSSNCSPSLWSVAVWFQRDWVLWHSLQVWKPVPSVFMYLVQYACNPQFAAYVVICFVVIKGVACQRSQ